MDIIQLQGEDERLYTLVAHLVMSKKALSYNLNYPYRTAADYVWFIATEGGAVVGFAPVKQDRVKVKINNYYVENDNSDVFAALLQAIVSEFAAESYIEAITQIRHVPEFEKNGFKTTLCWTKYAKMQGPQNEKKKRI
jgi:hypothetical protein